MQIARPLAFTRLGRPLALDGQNRRRRPGSAARRTRKKRLQSCRHLRNGGFVEHREVVRVHVERVDLSAHEISPPECRSAAQERHARIIDPHQHDVAIIGFGDIGARGAST